MSSAKNKKIGVGDDFPTNEGGRVVVVEYVDAQNVLVKHLDDYGYEVVVRAGDMRKGRVKNPYRPSVYGVGFIGTGEYKVREGDKKTIEYVTWYNMLTRCYCPKKHEKNPTYIGCSVDERWHNFQVFGKWFNEQRRDDGWQLDKDLLKDGNKVYSPETCRFIPSQLNSLLTDSGRARGELSQGVSTHRVKYKAEIRTDGERIYLGIYPTEAQAFAVYKKAKEENIKRMANVYKDEICPLVYQSLMAYDIKP